MHIGKRNQPRSVTPTPIGDIRADVGLDPRHARAALRFGHPSEPGAAPAPIRSKQHLRDAVRLMIGCARRAGMGSIRAVAEATRAIVTTVARRRGDVAAAARGSVAAATSADERLTLTRPEAAAAAALAALDAARELKPEDARDVRQAVVTAAFGEPAADRPAAEIITLRPPQDPVAARRTAAAFVRGRVERGREIADAPSEIVHHAATCLEASVAQGQPAKQSIRDVSHALLKSGYHRGRDVGRIARGIVQAAARSARRLGLERAEAAGHAAAHAVDASQGLGRHALRRVWQAVALPAARTRAAV